MLTLTSPFYFRLLPGIRRSHEWGVMPWHWYFTSALPRALHAAYALAPLGALLERRVQAPLAVALAFVLLYSNLGHKEVRFLFPVLPLWNLAAAAAVQRVWLGRRKSAIRRLLLLALAGALAAGLALTVVTAAASRHNYPGGDALRQLYSLAVADAAAAAAQGRELRVHIGVAAAMTGVSRFGEAGPPWSYCKAEGLSNEQLWQRRYDFLLTDQAEVQGYKQLAAVQGFQRLRLSGVSPSAALKGLLQNQLPLQVETAPRVFIQRHLGL
jgi:alpha-1,6-mannosyltransferase